MKVACPTCAKQHEWTSENKYRPFCSERCKQIDLGAWASDQYRVAGPSLEEVEQAAALDQAHSATKH